MKIRNIFIQDFRMLKEFSVDFENPTSLLIGKNGSGKSTLLEAIAQIFSSAILNKNSPFGFKIEYCLNYTTTIEETTTTGDFNAEIIEVVMFANHKDEKITTVVFTPNKTLDKKEDIIAHFGSIDKIYPSNIIVYYSGLSERLKAICQPHNDILSRQRRDGKLNAKRSFFYFDNPVLDVFLIALLSYEFGDVVDFFINNSRIRGINSVQISLKKPTWASSPKIEHWWGTKGDAKILLDYLEKNSLNSFDYLEANYDNKKGTIILEAFQNEALTITIIGLNKLYEIREYFIEEKSFFNALIALIDDGLWNNAKISLIDSNNKKLDLISEGEQQLITIKAISKLLIEDNTLLLFDEPDTYLHPQWQRSFLENLEEVVEHSNAHLIVTSHSPFMASAARKSQLFIMENEDGKAKLKETSFNPYGKTAEQVLIDFFDLESTRPPKVTAALRELLDLVKQNAYDTDRFKEKFDTLQAEIGADDSDLIRIQLEITKRRRYNEKNP